MRKSLNDRQERFIKSVAAGKNTTQGALAAGYSPTYSKAAGQKLAKNPEIKAAIDAIRAEGRKEAAFDLAAAMAEAQDAAVFARSKDNAMALVKAIALRCELSGLLIQQIHLNAEVVDIRAALEEAKARTLNVTSTVEPLSSLSLPSPARPLPVDEPSAQASARPAWSPFSE